MKRYILSAVFCAAAAFAQVNTIEGWRIRPHVKFLASDLLEGRGVGARGGQLAAEYIATEFEGAGLKPAGDAGTFYQKVPLVVVAAEPGAVLKATAGAKSLDLKWLQEWVGDTYDQQPVSTVDADAIFVGHGITAPEFGWDDFKGVDVRGKLLVLFTNEPASDDPSFFGGKALTYYGRWSYKYEEAMRRGAAGAIIIHTTPTASYGWNVVQGSWGHERPQVKLTPADPHMAVAGWVTTEAGGKLLALSGKTVEELMAAAEKKDFQPIPLGVHVRIRLANKTRDIESQNVVGKVEGSDPRLSQEAVVFTAHWDHLGIGPTVNGDSIYNGAVDNATGCAMLMEMARAWASLTPKPRRSAIFVAVTSEEAGLIGSEYYGKHPTIPAGRIAANLNFDGYYPVGRTKDVVVTGAERTTLWPLVQQTAHHFQLTISGDPEPGAGHYYRSDHFSMARVGVPSFSISQGEQFEGKPLGYGKKIYDDYNNTNYHQPSDEYKADWDFSGMEFIARFGFTLGVEIGNQDRLPTWQPGDEFFAAREKSWRR
jgi:Zn-dependent M28 family amino/carboxypeptidase